MCPSPPPQSAVLTCFPQALSPEELECPAAAPLQARSLWHRMSEEEQRVVLFQLQRLMGMQLTHSFDPLTHELVVKDVQFPGRCGWECVLRVCVHRHCEKCLSLIHGCVCFSCV